MKHTNDSFNQVLAHYVFEVANHYIESVEPAVQTDLINLLTKVTSSVDYPAPAKNLPEPDQFEWEQILKKPIDWKSVYQQWLMNVKQTQINQRKAYVARLERVIEATRCRGQQMQGSQLTEPHRSQLVAYYEQTLAVYQQQLDRAMSIHKAEWSY